MLCLSYLFTYIFKKKGVVVLLLGGKEIGRLAIYEARGCIKYEIVSYTLFDRKWYS